MAFDLSTARPVSQKTGFDLSTAQPVEQPQEDQSVMNDLISQYQSGKMSPRHKELLEEIAARQGIDLGQFGANTKTSPAMRGLGLGTRDVIQGMADVPLMLGDVANVLQNYGISGFNKVFGTNIPQGMPPTESLNKILTAAGLPVPETTGEKIQSAIQQGAAGGLATAGIGSLASGLPGATGQIANVLKEAPVMQTISGATGTGAAETTKELGGSPTQQTIAGIVGAALPGAGEASAKGLAKVASKIYTPEKAYGSAIKLPLTKAWKKVLGEEGVTKRTEAIRAGLESEIVPSESGIAAARNLEQTYRDSVDSIISELDSSGTLIPKETLLPGLKKAIDVAEKEGIDTGKIIDKFYNKRFENMGTPVLKYKDGELVETRLYKPSEIQKIKRHLYSVENYTKNQLSKSIGTKIRELSNKDMARRAKQSLENLYPELKQLNKNDAAYIGLTEALENAVPRIANRDAVGLGAKVLLTGTHPFLGVIELALGGPKVKAKLAFALNKARKAEIIKPAAQNILKGELITSANKNGQSEEQTQ